MKKNAHVLIISLILVCLFSDIVISMRSEQNRKCETISIEHENILKIGSDILLYKKTYQDQCNCWSNIFLSKKKIEKWTDSRFDK